MKKSKRKAQSIMAEKCSYKDFVTLFQFCNKDVQEDLLTRLRKQKKPFSLCGKEVPQNLNAISYGMLDDLRNVASTDDPVGGCANILLGIDNAQLLYQDVNDVFGFVTFVTKELEKINKLFSDIKHTYSKEEEAAGIHDLDFGSFGVLDWYARRMGISNQNDVRDVAWVRIYQCMKNDNMQSEFERRLHKQYMNNNKAKSRKR